MKKNVKKCILMATVAGICISAGLPQAPAYAAPGTTVATTIVNVNEEQPSVINWDNGSQADVQVMGIGLPPENVYGPRGSILARRAAIVDAQRNLVEAINGVQVDAETTVENLAVANDTVRTKVSAAVKGARILKEYANNDGSYTVIMSVPMYGVTNSVAAAAIPSVVTTQTPMPLPVVNPSTTPLPQPEIAATQTAGYTGVIVDASGLGLEPTFAPVIYDENGRAIYGISNLDYKFAINKGMVGYSRDLQQAAVNSRAGSNPLIVRALDVRGGANSAVNMVNVVVSVEDGDKILLANERSHMLNKCAVVFVR